MADRDSKSVIFCGTCEKGFARKKTYDDHFFASKNKKCRDAPTRISAKSRPELNNLKSLSLFNISEHFQLEPKSPKLQHPKMAFIRQIEPSMKGYDAISILSF